MFGLELLSDNIGRQERDVRASELRTVRELMVKVRRTVQEKSANNSRAISLNCAVNSSQRKRCEIQISDELIACNERACGRIKYRNCDEFESRAVRSSSSRDVSSHSATSSIASAFSSANSANLSVVIANLIFGDTLQTSLFDLPRTRRVIELARLVPSSCRITDRKAMTFLSPMLLVRRNETLEQLNLPR